jgi:hypothetical protein
VPGVVWPGRPRPSCHRRRRWAGPGGDNRKGPYRYGPGRGFAACSPPCEQARLDAAHHRTAWPLANDESCLAPARAWQTHSDAVQRGFGTHAVALESIRLSGRRIGTFEQFHQALMERRPAAAVSMAGKGAPFPPIRSKIANPRPLYHRKYLLHNVSR